jgi:two-component sensor histidine kinase
MVQDHRGRYWIASNAGLAYFDGYNFTYLTSENGVKSVDIVNVKFLNKHLYTFSVNQIEAIDISKLNHTYKTNLYDFDVFNRFGHEKIKNNFVVFYTNGVDIFHNNKRVQIKNLDVPFYNLQKDKFQSLLSANSNLNKSELSFAIDITDKNQYYISFNQIYKKDSNGNLRKYCLVPFTSADYGTAYSIDSNYFLLSYITIDKFEIYSRKLNQSNEIFKGITPLGFNLYRTNGFTITSFKNGIYLYCLHTYSKKKLTQFSYSDFHRERSILLENKLNEFSPAIKKQGQMYSFCHNGKWIKYSGVIKSLIKLDTENFIIGRRDGTCFFHIKDDQTKIPKFIDSSWVLRLRKMDTKLFVLTYDNFKLLQGNTKKIFKLKYKGGYVLVNDLEYFNNQYVLGTNDQGIFISDTGFEKFKHISEKEGLQSKLVKRIKTDEQGNIWVLSDKGVDKIDQNNKVTKIFSITEIEDYDITNFSASTDSLWLFSDDHVYSLNYRERFKPQQIPIVLNTLTVDNTQTYYEGDSLISIGPRWERIKINYAGIYLHEQEYIAYRYRIVYNGDSSSWQTTKLNNLDLVALRPGHYEILIEAYHSIYPNIKSKQLTVKFYIKPYFYQTWWFYGLTTLLILGSILGFLWYRNQLRLKALKLEAELNRYRLTGLQNQMNPHFVFNSMSTIQNLILNNDKEDALNFISDFSTLMRTMLQNARNDQISLVNELEFLQKYIDLEKIRYRNSFDYALDLAIDEFELEDIYIPTMMVQPLLENAVKHGVSNLSDRPGHIQLKIRLDETNESLLIIQIIDNGHGQSTHGLKNHSSTALKVIKERLAIYSKHGIFGSLDILYTPEGTICTLKLPI